MNKKIVLRGLRLRSGARRSPRPPFAEDSIYVPLFTYRTGPFAGSGTPIADGMHDYLTMLNERDGGIGGVKLMVDECETGYDTKKGLECYDSVKPKNPVIVNPWSTGITLSLIPKASVDKIPILSHGLWPFGLRQGRHLPLGFQSARHLLGRPLGNPQIYRRRIDRQAEGQDDRLSLFRRGLRQGADPDVPGPGEGLRLRSEALSRRAGRHAEPIGAMARRAPRQARFRRHVRLGRDERRRRQGGGQGRLSRWTSSSRSGGRAKTTLRSAGDGAKGFKTLNWHGVGADYPALQDIKKLVIDAGKSQAAADEFGGSLYDRGVYNSVLIAEAIANAQKLTGKKVVTGEDVRRGLETINLDAGALQGAWAGGLRRAVQAHLRRPQQPQRDLRPAMGRREMGEDHRSDRAGKRQGAAADRRGRQGLCREERRLAGAHRGLRQQVVTLLPSRGRRWREAPDEGGRPITALTQPSPARAAEGIRSRS